MLAGLLYQSLLALVKPSLNERSLPGYNWDKSAVNQLFLISWDGHVVIVLELFVGATPEEQPVSEDFNIHGYFIQNLNVIS
jgi:hypothetical protein